MEAALVRIMKSRKTLSHQSLIAEAMEHCRRMFEPLPKALKTRIERLIETEYLRRDDDDSNLLHYVP